MFWPIKITDIFNTYPPQPTHKWVWLKVKILHETDKAILVYYDNRKAWIPKSRIHKIKLKKDVFEVYVKITAF